MPVALPRSRIVIDAASEVLHALAQRAARLSCDSPRQGAPSMSMAPKSATANQHDGHITMSLFASGGHSAPARHGRSTRRRCTATIRRQAAGAASQNGTKHASWRGARSRRRNGARLQAPTQSSRHRRRWSCASLVDSDHPRHTFPIVDTEDAQRLAKARRIFVRHGLECPSIRRRRSSNKCREGQQKLLRPSSLTLVERRQPHRVTSSAATG